MRLSTMLFKKFFLTVLGFVISILMVDKLYAQISDPSPIAFPTPKNVANMLFYLQRDPNTNTLIYALNLANDGSIKSDNPVSIYWVRYGEDGAKKALGYIQKKFAYGLITREITKDKFELRFVSHKALPLYLTKADQKYIVMVTANSKNIRINRLFVRIVGGSFWLPNVRYALIEGTDMATGKPVTEKIPVK
ncbi:DUF4833 domain-containing protein [Pedobacter aquatilis]|uniref:DUF4833 domain-containing protein n=1 Tax=Pedobacter aquatilis TaxID=351343 RepID=UPI0029306C73|nr:DUF4833 domain-containing protein [Pedobacter aquatilis]